MRSEPPRRPRFLQISFSQNHFFPKKIFFSLYPSKGREENNDSSLSIDREHARHIKYLFFDGGGMRKKKKKLLHKNSWRRRRREFFFLFFKTRYIFIWSPTPRASPSLSSFRNANATFALRRDHKEGEDEERCFANKTQLFTTTNSGQSREQTESKMMKTVFKKPNNTDQELFPRHTHTHTHTHTIFFVPRPFTEASAKDFSTFCCPLPCLFRHSGVFFFFIFFIHFFLPLFPKKKLIFVREKNKK